jgi:hypothetical protein
MKLLAIAAFAVYCLNIPQHPIQFLNIPSLADTITWCSAANDLFEPDRLILTPESPVRGEPLIVSVNGTLSKKVEQGSIAHVKVKLGFIQLLDSDYDLCKQSSEIGYQCPFEKGYHEFHHKVDIPKELPPVKPL